jgi:hypothetical protein
MGAFASAGFVVLPPIHGYTTVMLATVSIGVLLVYLAWTSSTMFKILTRIQTTVLSCEMINRFLPLIFNLIRILNNLFGPGEGEVATG